MKEEWVELDEFPNYAISNYGQVVNIKYGGREIQLSHNQQGLPKVTLIADGRPITRSPVVLVANAFIPQDGRDNFDTPIQLDGDRMNCRADNLMWRPRWFAIKYHQQFGYARFHEDRCPVIDLETKIVYPSVREVCTTFGVHWIDVYKSYLEGRMVWPDGRRFSSEIS